MVHAPGIISRELKNKQDFGKKKNKSSEASFEDESQNPLNAAWSWLHGDSRNIHLQITLKLL